MKLIKVTLQKCGIPGGPGGVTYRVDKLVNTVSLEPAETGGQRSAGAGDFLSAGEASIICRSPRFEVTILAPRD